MSRRSSIFIELLVALALVCGARRAEAQACCAGGGAYAPARLKMWEEGAVGLQLHGGSAYGSFDTGGRYFPNGAGDAELDFEEDLLGSYRLTHELQIGAVVPFLETWRGVASLSGGGGGIGDVSLNGLYEIRIPGGGRTPPGIAITATVTAPTGRAPEQALTPLAVDATGAGYWQGGLGVTAEQAFGRWLLSGTFSVSGVLPRRVGDVSEVLGPQLSGLVAGGYMLQNGAAIVGIASCRATTGTWVNGTAISGNPVLTTVGVAVGWPLDFEWRLQGALTGDLPVLGVSRETNLALAATLLRTF